MKKTIFYFLVFMLFGLFVIRPANAARAATLGVVVNNVAPDIGQPIRIDVALDTQDDDVNAIQAQIVFPAAQFTLRSVNDGESPVSFWIQQPTEVASGVVAFSGIIPGGFQGAASSVVSLWLLPTAGGAGTISLDDIELLQNDGEGTPIAVATGTVAVDVSASVVSSTPPRPVSFSTPENFVPVISQNPNIYGGKYFLSFSTTDKGSGIDHYEVLEVPAAGSAGTWQVATSPYLLRDQSLESNIYVRAVDHAGNFLVVEVPAEHPVKAGGLWIWVWHVLGGVVIACILGWFISKVLLKK